MRICRVRFRILFGAVDSVFKKMSERISFAFSSNKMFWLYQCTVTVLYTVQSCHTHKTNKRIKRRTLTQPPIHGSPFSLEEKPDEIARDSPHPPSPSNLISKKQSKCSIRFLTLGRVSFFPLMLTETLDPFYYTNFCKQIQFPHLFVPANATNTAFQKFTFMLSCLCTLYSISSHSISFFKSLHISRHTHYPIAPIGHTLS